MTRSNVALLVLLPVSQACRCSAAPMRCGSAPSRACIRSSLSSWNVVGGFAGYPSFATAAFFGFGAYMTGVLLNKGMPLLPSVLLTLVTSLLLTGLLGAVLLRLRGHYFAIASLSLDEVLRELVNTRPI